MSHRTDLRGLVSCRERDNSEAQASCWCKACWGEETKGGPADSVTGPGTGNFGEFDLPESGLTENALKCQKVVRTSTSLRAYTSSTRYRFDLHVIFRYSLSQHQSTAVRSDSGRFPIRFLAWHAHVCQETLTFSQRLIAPWDQVNRRIPRQQSGGRSVRARGRGPIRIRA